LQPQPALPAVAPLQAITSPLVQGTG
jgi:hypothetical protein